MATNWDHESIETSKLRELVLKVLCDDIESLQTLVGHLNATRLYREHRFRSHTFTWTEILPLLEDLVREEMVKVLQYSETTRRLEELAPGRLAIRDQLDDLWFKLTEKGYATCKEWKSPDQSSAT